MEVRLIGYGSLFRWLSAGEKGEMVRLAPGATLTELIQQAGVPDQEIWMATINGKRASMEQVLQDGDEVRLFSPLGGGS